MKKWISGILALTVFAIWTAPSFAALTDPVLGASSEWANAGTRTDATTLTANSADELDDVTLGANTLTFTNDGVNDDSGSFNSFSAGTLSSTTTGGVTITTGANATNTVAVTAINLTGAGAVLVTNRDADNANIVASTTSTLSTGGTVTLTNAETSAANTIALTVGGNYTATGATTINGGGFAGATSTLTLNGATNTATGGIVLNTGTAAAILALGANATTLSGAITAQAAGEGNITTAGSTTISGQIGTNALYVNSITQNTASSTLTFGSNVFGTSFSQGAANTLDIGANTMDFDGAAGNFALNATSTLRLTINSATAFGNILLGAGNFTIANTNSLYVTVNGAVINGQTYAITTGAGDSIATLPTVTDSSPIVSFALTEPSNDDLRLTATVNTSAISTGAAGDAVLGTLSTAVNNGTATTALSNDVGQIYMLTSTQAITDAVNQLDPVMDGATTQTSFQNAGLINSVVSGRLETARTGNGGTTGIAAGDIFQDSEIWAKGYGHFADQDNRGGQDGYDADTWGTIIGIDGPLNDEWRLGVAGGYSNSDVDTKNQNSTSDIDSVQGSLYGEYTSGPWYLDTSFTFAYNMYEGTRGIAFGTINRAAQADYDGQQYTGYIGTGYTQTVDGWEFTPNLSLTYSHLYLESYTEIGANALSLNVASQDYDFLQSGLGLKIAHPYKCDAGQWIPEVHAKWLYDFIGDEQATSSSFTGGGASFTTRGFDPAQHSFNVGGGISIVTNVRWTVEAVYDLELKEDYTAHSGTLTARYKF